MRRVRLRGRQNVSKRFVIHAAAQNLALIMRAKFGCGTPRGLAAALAALLAFLSATSAGFRHAVDSWVQHTGAGLSRLYCHPPPRFAA